MTLPDFVDSDGNVVLPDHGSINQWSPELKAWLLVSHNPDGTLRSKIPVEPPPSTIKFAHRQASNYSDTMPGTGSPDTIIQQGQKFRYVCIQGFNSDAIPDLKAGGGTTIAVALYKEITYCDTTNPGSTNPSNDPDQQHAVAYQDAGWTEAWFAHQAGQPHDAAHRLSFNSGRNILYNVANTGLQQKAATSMISEMTTLGFDSIFLDNALWKLDVTGGVYPDEAPNQAAWQTAIEGYLAYVTTQIRNAGFKVYGNIGSSANTAFLNRRPYWVRNYFQNGGAMEEGWIRSTVAHTGARASIEDFWIPNFINILQDSELAGIHFLAEIPADDYSSGAQAVEDIRYGIGLVLIASKCDGSTTIDIGGSPNPGDGTHYWKEAVIPELADMIKLGTPLGAYQSQGGGCYLRTFQNGICVLNPHNTSKVASLPLGTWAGWGVASAATSLTIAATTAKVLFMTSASPYITKASENTMAGFTSPTTQTLFSVPSNSTVIVEVAVASPTQSVSGVTDQLGNAYTNKAKKVGSALTVETWMAQNVTGGDLNITVTLTASRDHSWNASAWMFLADAATFETGTKVEAEIASTTTPTPPAYTPGAVPVVILASLASLVQGTSPTGGFTAMTPRGSGADPASVYLATAFKYMESGAGTPQTISWTLASAGISEASIIGIKNA